MIGYWLVQALQKAAGGKRAVSLLVGSMGPKVEAACRFAEATGDVAAIGQLDHASALLDGTAGTTVMRAV